jgi:uncharacterized delta-60 repeat protein
MQRFAVPRFHARVRRCVLVSAVGLSVIAGISGTIASAPALGLTVGVTPGDPDPTYGQGGAAAITTPDRGGEARDAVLDDNGAATLLLQSDRDYLARMFGSGDPDPNFAGGGLARLFGDSAPFVWSLIRDGNGRLLVAGLNEGSDMGFVSRSLSDGRPDPSFGTGGVAQLDGGEPLTLVGIAQGKTLIAGYSLKGGPPTVLWRLNRDGSPDESFGDHGRQAWSAESGIAVLLPFGAYDGGAGRVLLTGYILHLDEAGNFSVDEAVSRVGRDGLPDPSFGRQGTAFPELEGWSLGARAAVQKDGKIVVAGTSLRDDGGLDAMLTRFTSNGQPDRSFAASGVARITLPNAADVGRLFGVVVQPDRHIVGVGVDQSSGNALLVRLLNDGRLDRTFGQGGASEADFAGGSVAYQIGLAGAGKLLTAGVFAGRPGTARFLGGTLLASPGVCLSAAGCAQLNVSAPGYGTLGLLGALLEPAPPGLLRRVLDLLP